MGLRLSHPRTVRLRHRRRYTDRSGRSRTLFDLPRLDDLDAAFRRRFPDSGREDRRRTGRSGPGCPRNRTKLVRHIGGTGDSRPLKDELNTTDLKYNRAAS